jgi:hypothetical protein
VKRKHISLNLVVVDDQDKSSLIANVNVGWIWGCIPLLCNLRTYDDYLFFQVAERTLLPHTRRI